MTVASDKYRCNFTMMLLALLLLFEAGCKSNRHFTAAPIAFSESDLTEIDYPQLPSESFGVPPIAPPPVTDLSMLPASYWDLTLEECHRIAFSNVAVLRSLGATIINNPLAAAGSYDPAIQSTDPIFGIEAALSQFDASWNSSLLHSKNDDVFNNPILGGGAAEVRDDVSTLSSGIRKTNAFGTQFSVQNRVQHSNSNNPALLFPHSWTTVWEGTVRQPLMQGRGTQFNRIAGPNGQPGFRTSTGVVISQINQEISVAQFERGVCNMAREISNTYWQLSLAYQKLESTKRVRDIGLQTWNATKARYEFDLQGGGAAQEASAHAQYLQFQSQVIADVSGGAQPNNQLGLLQAEANLRRLLGLPQSDGTMIRPVDLPYKAPVVYDWTHLVGVASVQRLEIREQEWRVKQRELQLLASRNFLLPRLDLLSTYRINGFGDDLAGGGSGRFSSALKDAASNDHGEVDFGVVYDFPVGYRQAHAAVKNAELLLCRERAILEEQRQQIIFELGNALRSIYRSQIDLDVQSQRVDAARNAVQALDAAFTADAITIDQLLDAHERLLNAERAYFDSLLAVQQSHLQLLFESGQLLHTHQILISELN